MKTQVCVLRDIQLRPNGHVYTLRCSRIEYDAKRKTEKKLHYLIHQQGSRYGTVGDSCDMLTHAELLNLQRKGFVQVIGRRWRHPEDAPGFAPSPRVNP
jgi:hypothetical protein